jgi:cell division protein FtsB
VALYVGFLFGGSMLFFWGHSGIYSYNKLVNYRNSLEANIKDLEQINQQLLNDIDALGSNPEIVALQARELGFFKDDEHVIRIENYSAGGNIHKVGRLIYKAEGKATRDILVKISAFFLPLLFYLFSHIVLKGNADKYR